MCVCVCNFGKSMLATNVRVMFLFGLPGDPDIDTMPLLAWSLRMAECAKDSPFARFMIRYQVLTRLMPS